MPEKLDRGIQQLRRWAADHKNLLLPFVFLCVIYFLGILPILQADRYYVDDLGRAYRGYAGWGYYSRYLTMALSLLLHTGKYLTDISPLPQLLAIPVMGAAAVICLCTLSERDRFSLFHYAALIPFALSPYFLQCLSYKYDAPYMALSVLLSVFPLLFSRNRTWLYALISVFCTVCMCLTYQASAGIYPMLVVALCLKRWIAGESFGKTARFAALSAVSYVVGLVLFRSLILRSADSYASTEMLPLAQMLPGAVKHYKNYVTVMISDLKTEWLLVSALICVGALCAVVMGSQRNKLLTLLLSVLLFGLMFLLAFGVYPFLTRPTHSPRCMYGLGIFLSIMGLLAADHGRIHLPKFGCLVLGWMFFVFCFTYGNALALQGEYDDYRMQLVIDDLLERDLLDPDEPVRLRITGSAGYAPAIRNMPGDYQMLRRLVPVGFCDSSNWWGGYEFEAYYGLDKAIKITSSTDYPWDELPTVADNMLHTIRAGDGLIWIELR